MANNYTIVGNDIEYGIEGLSVPWGVVTNESSEPDVRVQEYDTGANGSIGTAVLEERKQTLKLDILRSSGSSVVGSAESLPLPDIGDIVTVDSINYAVTAKSKTRKRGDAATLSVSLTKWNGITLPNPTP